MTCPFFIPTNKADDIEWLHPARLPLGAGWHGRCGSPGHEGFSPTPEEIRENCNLGYAVSCARLPQQRSCDAVRFSVSRDSFPQLTVQYVFETDHRPAGYGTLQYDVSVKQWTSPHSDERTQRMADCYVQSYLSRRNIPPESPSHKEDNATK